MSSRYYFDIYGLYIPNCQLGNTELLICIISPYNIDSPTYLPLPDANIRKLEYELATSSNDSSLQQFYLARTD